MLFEFYIAFISTVYVLTYMFDVAYTIKRHQDDDEDDEEEEMPESVKHMYS